jgi:hypothetical protein
MKSSLFPKNQIHDPATARVGSVAAEVAEDVVAGAAGFFEGVGEDRHGVEAAVGIDAMGEGGDGGSEPGGVEGDGAEGVVFGFTETLEWSPVRR